MRLAVLRPADRLEESSARAREMGFDTITASPLAIVPNDAADIDELIDELRLQKVAYVVITSSTSVASLLTLAKKREVNIISLLNRCTLVAIGPATAEAMRAGGIRVDMMPKEYTSTGLVDLLSSQGVAGKRIWLLRSDHGDKRLVTGLEDAGASVREMAIYRLVPQTDDAALEQVVKEAIGGNIDAFAFTSALTAATFVRAAERFAPREEMIAMLNARTVAAIGLPTRRKLEGMGIRVEIMPEHATFESMLAALRQATSK